MPMHREGFSDYLHRRRVALGKKWKTVLSEAYLSRATLHRIRNGDPHHPIAEVDSMRALAHAMKFPSWTDMVAAFERKIFPQRGEIEELVHEATQMALCDGREVETLEPCVKFRRTNL